MKAKDLVHGVFFKVHHHGDWTLFQFSERKAKDYTYRGVHAKTYSRVLLGETHTEDLEQYMVCDISSKGIRLKDCVGGVWLNAFIPFSDMELFIEENTLA